MVNQLCRCSRGLRRSKCLEALHQLHYIKKFEQAYPDSLEFMQYCLQAEVNNPESGMNPSAFCPLLNTGDKSYAYLNE